MAVPCSGLQGEEWLQVLVPSVPVPHPTWQCRLSAGWGSCTARAKVAASPGEVLGVTIACAKVAASLWGQHSPC